MMTEYLATPHHVKERLEYFQAHEFADLLQATAQERDLAAELKLLNFDLNRLVSRCSDSLNVSQTAAIIAQYDSWCERFEEVESVQFEEAILDAWIALPQ